MSKVLMPLRDWIVENNRRRFWLSEIVKGTGIERRKVLRVLERLRKQGFLDLVEEKKVAIEKAGEFGPARREPKFEVVKDLSFLRPGAKKHITARDRIWRTLRILRRATKSELQRLSGCSESAVYEYIRLLKHYGYIRPVGKRGREIVYFLMKDVGGRRPITPEIKGRCDDELA